MRQVGSSLVQKSTGQVLSSLAFVDGGDAGGAFVFVQMVLFDVVDDGDGDQVADAHLPTQEETDFGAADVVLDELLDDIDVVFPWLQGCQGFVDVGSAAFDDEGLPSVNVCVYILNG